MRSSSSVNSTEVTLSLCLNSLRQFSNLDVMGCFFLAMYVASEAVKSMQERVRNLTHQPRVATNSANFSSTTNKHLFAIVGSASFLWHAKKKNHLDTLTYSQRRDASEFSLRHLRMPRKLRWILCLSSCRPFDTNRESVWRRRD